MSIPVVSKYMACTEFDPVTEECTAVAWVDPPLLVPPLTKEQGAAFAGACVLVWSGVMAFVLIRKGARTQS